MKRRSPFAAAALLAALALAALLGASLLIERSDVEGGPRGGPTGGEAEPGHRPPRVELAATVDAVSSAAPVGPVKTSPPTTERAGDRPLDPAPAVTTPAGASPAPGRPLGRVRGVVIDATTRMPLEGAWVGWEAPDRRSWSVAPAGQGARTGADGRFEVDRSAGAWELHAIAQGYATRAVTPGLREDVVVPLPLMSVLEVRLRGALEPTPRLTLLRDAGDGDEVEVESSLAEPGAPPWRVEHLAEGPYVLRVDGVPAVRVDLRAGATTTLGVEVPPLAPLALRIVDEVGAPAAGWKVVLVPSGEQTFACIRRMHELRTDPAGRVSAEVRPGRFRVLAERRRESNADEVLFVGEVATGPLEVELRVPPLAPITVSGPPDVVKDVALVPTTGDGFVELDEVSPGERSARVPPGRYLLFVREDSGRTVDVPAGGLRLRHDEGLVEVALRWRLPEDTPVDLVVGARLHVVPAALPRGALRRLVEEEASLGQEVEVRQGGRATLRLPPGEVDLVVLGPLGRVERRVEVVADQPLELEVVLPP